MGDSSGRPLGGWLLCHDRKVPPSPSSQTFGVRADGWLGAGPFARTRVSTTTVQLVLAAAIVPMVAVTVWLALTSDHLQRPVASALYWSYLTAAPMAIGLYWWMRRPASRFGPLLVTFGIMAWVISWESSDWPLPFDIGVLLEGPFLAHLLPLPRLPDGPARAAPPRAG